MLDRMALPREMARLSSLVSCKRVQTLMELPTRTLVWFSKRTPLRPSTFPKRSGQRIRTPHHPLGHLYPRWSWFKECNRETEVQRVPARSSFQAGPTLPLKAALAFTSRAHTLHLSRQPLKSRSQWVESITVASSSVALPSPTKAIWFMERCLPQFIIKILIPMLNRVLT